MNTDCDRNLLACDPVATTLHLDALRVAKDPDKLLKALIAVGDHYLKIDNPLGHFGNFPEGQRLVAVTAAPVTAGTNLEIALGKDVKLPITLTLWMHFPDTPADAKPELFTFPLSHYLDQAPHRP